MKHLTIRLVAVFGLWILTNSAKAAPQTPIIDWLPETTQTAQINLLWYMSGGENGDNWYALLGDKKTCINELRADTPNYQNSHCTIQLKEGINQVQVALCLADDCSYSKKHTVTYEQQARRVSLITTDSLLSPTFIQNKAFSPYVDPTVDSEYRIRIDKINQEYGVQQFTLAFIVAAKNKACEPSWAHDYLIEKDGTPELLEQIQNLRSNGGDIQLAFGGEQNSELANKCQTAEDLYKAYAKAIDVYKVNKIEISLNEHFDLADRKAHQRRLNALKRLKRAKPELQIWMGFIATLGGLPPSALALLTEYQRHGIAIRGVNLIVTSLPVHSNTMLTRMMDNALAQMLSIYPMTNIKRVSRMLAVSPMIGMTNEALFYDTKDAVSLVEMANRLQIGMISMWSLNRDRPCEKYKKEILPYCSGLTQKPFEFSQIFNSYQIQY